MLELAVLAEETGRALAPAALRSTWWAAALLTAAGEAERLAGGRRGAVADAWREVAARDGALHGEKRLVLDVPGADVARRRRPLGGRPRRGRGRGPPGARRHPPARDRALRRHAGRAARGRRARPRVAREPAGVRGGERRRRPARARHGGRPTRRSAGSSTARWAASRPSRTAARRCCSRSRARAPVVQWAGWALDHAPEEAELATHAAHAYASDCGVRVTQSALQVLGGLGFTWEHDLHLLLKRARANAHALGIGRRRARADRRRAALAEPEPGCQPGLLEAEGVKPVSPRRTRMQLHANAALSLTASADGSASGRARVVCGEGRRGGRSQRAHVLEVGRAVSGRGRGGTARSLLGAEGSRTARPMSA